ncbi:MAG: dipeptidase [Candidatus Krumholzibacteriia bacterium]
MSVIPIVAMFALFSGAGEKADGGRLVEARYLADAKRLAQEFIIADTHIDVPYRLWKKMDNISAATEDGDFDYPRAREGGLDAVFMSIYTPWELEKQGGSKALADSLIDLVEGFAVQWPAKFALAASVDEVREAVDANRIALMLGMENGSPVEGELENLAYFFGRGVRYITLTHSKDNHICDSSYDTSGTWGGLSPFGKKVVAEMNRLGIIIDVSHLSDEAFYQVMELSHAPVVASHSSARHFTPGFERNMDDDMIRLLARKGGVIQINFGSIFISDECRRRFYAGKDKAEEYALENGLEPGGKEARAWRKAYFEKNPVGFADVSDVANHIDHVVRLVGVDHVGFGSDFDGVGDSLPTGLKDVSQYPNLIATLLARGYSEEHIEKMCSGNVLRVWREVERIARESRASR